jgi:hypothetical protein
MQKIIIYPVTTISADNSSGARMRAGFGIGLKTTPLPAGRRKVHYAGKEIATAEMKIITGFLFMTSVAAPVSIIGDRRLQSASSLSGAFSRDGNS